MSVLTVELDGILHLTLNKPEKHNAFDPEMIELLTESFLEAQDNPHIRCIVLRGEGPSFCSGADLSWMKSMKDFSLEENKADSLKLYKMFEAAYNCTHPIVGVFHGNIFGGAIGLAAICDVGVAHESAKFCFSEVRLGLAPAVISPFILKKMNRANANELMITGKMFKAKEALASGLVQYVESDSDFENKIKKIISKIGELGPEAVRATKKLIRMQDPLVDSVRDAAVSTISERRVSDEGQEGLKAFFDKADASWKRELNYES